MSKITSAILQKVAPGTPKAKRDRFLADFNSVLPKYGITTELRVAAFLTTVCFESDYFKALAEYADGWAYDISRNPKKARELRNIAVGDGPKYKGAGGIETTGKKNYKRLSDRLGVDFVNNPMLLRTEKYFVEAACVFWDDNKFNKLADAGKITAIQNITNRGSADKPAKALASRLKIYHNILDILPDDFKLGEDSPPAKKEEVSTEGPDVTTEENSVKVKVEGSNVEVEQNSNAPQAEPKIAVVAAKPPSFFTRLWAKVTGAILGNGMIQWGLDQAEKIQALSIPEKVWTVVTIMAISGTIIWLISEAVKGFQKRKRDKELEALLIEQHSTPENRAQIIHPDDIDYFKAKGWKIINTGDKIPDEVKASVV